MNAAAGISVPVHPAVRIVFFIAFSLYLAFGSLSQLIVAAVLLAVFVMTTGSSPFINTWRIVRRMRWLFFSILLVYAWFSPGQPLFADATASIWWMPSVEGVLAGGHRAMVLVMMILAVQWLLWVTERAELVAAIYWLAFPMAVVGDVRERMAVRIALVLTKIEPVQLSVVTRLRQTAVKRGDLRGYAAVAADLVSDVVDQGESERCHSIEIDVGNPPPLWQWSIPAVLVAVMWLAA